MRLSDTLARGYLLTLYTQEPHKGKSISAQTGKNSCHQIALKILFHGLSNMLIATGTNAALRGAPRRTENPLTPQFREEEIDGKAEFPSLVSQINS